MNDSPPVVEHLERLVQELEVLGLAPYQARVLVALLVTGSGDSRQLAASAGVGRTSIYKTLDALIDQGLAEPLPTHGPRAWACRGWRPVLDTLDAAADTRLEQHRARTSQLRHTLRRLLPDKEHLRPSDDGRGLRKD